MKNKDYLCIKILKKILRDKGVTRPELIQWSGVRPATLFQAIDVLKGAGLICEPERTRKYIGRKASQIIPSADQMWCVGLDFRIHGTSGVIIDMSGTIRYRAEIAASERNTLSECQQEIAEILRQLQQESGENWSKVRGIGFADPGLVDIPKGFSINAVNVPGWKNMDTGAFLRGKSGLETGVWPECYVKTYMEYRQRIKGDNGSLFLLEMDNGVGGGFFKDGKGFVGDTHQAMEIGHIIVDPDGPLCHCGNRGCLEAFVGETGIQRRIQHAIDNGVNTALEGGSFSWERFIRCAQYDKIARLIASEASESIGRALAVVVTLLNPSMIVLSGKLTGLNELLMSSVKRVLNLSCFAAAVQKLEIDFSSLREEDTAKGVACLIQEQLLTSLFGDEKVQRSGRSSSARLQ